MSNIIIFLITIIIKSYKYLVSPLIGSRCRYYPSCSDYFVKSLNELGIVKGLFFGVKRILSCHPFNFLGGGSGIDLVPPKKINKGKI